jgi:hypothetical protein
LLKEERVATGSGCPEAGEVRRTRGTCANSAQAGGRLLSLKMAIEGGQVP